MPSDPDLGAILTAMVTPFDSDGAVREDATRRLARHLVEHGSDGLVVSGTTGEAPTLDDAEKLRLFETVVDEVGDTATVVAGTGSNDTAHSVHLTRQASERGVDAVLVVTPYYNKPNRRGLLAHFSAVAAATDLPVIVYNIPARSMINLEPDLLAELGTDRQRRRGQAGQLGHGAGAAGSWKSSELALYAGDDNLLGPFAEIGGAGGITVSSHVAGEQMKELYEAARSGDVERSRALDRELEEVYRTLSMAPPPATVKAALGCSASRPAACGCHSSRLTSPSWRRFAGWSSRCGP